MKKIYIAPQTRCYDVHVEQMMALSTKPSNADPSNDVLAGEDKWGDMWE